MNLSLNEIQLAVLHWIDAGCDMAHPPTENFKKSAIALRSRGLIDLDRRRGRWNATIAEKGRYYLEHGHHPDAQQSKRAGTPKPQEAVPATPAKSVQRATKRAATTEATAARTAPARPAVRHAAEDETIPLPGQLRKPDPAIRELIDHKTRLDVPPEQRQRALLILHALVQESLRRGWTVTAVRSTMGLCPIAWCVDLVAVSL